jgi:hypothetical protein
MLACQGQGIYTIVQVGQPASQARLTVAPTKSSQLTEQRGWGELNSVLVDTVERGRNRNQPGRAPQAVGGMFQLKEGREYETPT